MNGIVFTATRVRRVLGWHPRMTDQQVAELVGTDPSYVRRIRNRRMADTQGLEPRRTYPNRKPKR